MQLEARPDFQQVVTTVATTFIDSSPKEHEERIALALRTLGEFADVDRALVFAYDPEIKKGSLLHEWCAAGIPSAKEYYNQSNGSGSAYQWFATLLSTGAPLVVDDTAALVNDAPDPARDLLKVRQVRSFMLVPMTHEGRLRGALGFSTVKKLKKWGNDELILLQITAEFFHSFVRRRRAEEQLLESDLRFRTLLENLGEGVIFADRADIIRHVNSTMARMLGYSAAEMVGQSANQLLFGPEAQAEMEQRIKRRLSGEAENYQIQLCRKDGSRFWAEIHATPMRDGDGTIIGSLGAITDVSAGKAALEALEHQREFLRQVIDTNPNPIYCKDRSGVFTLANKALADLYSVTADEIVGKHVSHFITSPEKLARFAAEDQEVLEEKVTKLIPETNFVDLRNQQLRWFQTIKKPFLSADRKTYHVLAVASEITARKHAEDEAMRLQRQLLQSQKMEAIGKLAAGIAHDLNNSLAAVVGHLQLLKMDPAYEGTGRRSVDVALSGCERATSLIERLLGFSRQGKYNLRTVALQKILHETLEFFSRIIGSDIHIRWEGERSNLFVRADEGQLQQALTNLIINARHAMPKGGELTFTLTRRRVEHAERFNPGARPGPFVTLAVGDTGCGIPAEIIDKIFEPFFTTKEQSEGTGLGLAMVYGILQNHGGWIEVESRVGVGSTFTMFLPEDQTADRAEQPVPTEALNTGNGVVLLIDDEVTLVDLGTQFLHLAGFAVQGFTDATKALEWYREHFRSVDIVVMDMKMPRMDGSACFKAVRTINPQASVVVLSGYIQDGAAQELLQQGALRFFQKPLRYPELVKFISEHLKEQAPPVKSTVSLPVASTPTRTVGDPTP